MCCRYSLYNRLYTIDGPFKFKCLHDYFEKVNFQKYIYIDNIEY